MRHYLRIVLFLLQNLDLAHNCDYVKLFKDKIAIMCVMMHIIAIFCINKIFCLLGLLFFQHAIKPLDNVFFRTFDVISGYSFSFQYCCFGF